VLSSSERDGRALRNGWQNISDREWQEANQKTLKPVTDLGISIGSSMVFFITSSQFYSKTDSLSIITELSRDQ
jgi:hypothetical protein